MKAHTDPCPRGGSVGVRGVGTLEEQGAQGGLPGVWMPVSRFCIHIRCEHSGGCSTHTVGQCLPVQGVDPGGERLGVWGGVWSRGSVQFLVASGSSTQILQHLQYSQLYSAQGRLYRGGAQGQRSGAQGQVPGVGPRGGAQGQVPGLHPRGRYQGWVPGVDPRGGSQG